jgi:hypothetical protein
MLLDEGLHARQQGAAARLTSVHGSSASPDTTQVRPSRTNVTAFARPVAEAVDQDAVDAHAVGARRGSSGGPDTIVQAIVCDGCGGTYCARASRSTVRWRSTSSGSSADRWRTTSFVSAELFEAFGLPPAL